MQLIASYTSSPGAIATDILRHASSNYPRIVCKPCTCLVSFVHEVSMSVCMRVCVCVCVCVFTLEAINYIK